MLSALVPSLLIDQRYRRFHIATNAMRDTQMTESETLTQFRANYGQLCVLVAKALLQGHSQEHVNAASRGKGHMVAPVYAGLRAQRRVTNRSLEACKAAGVSMREAVTVARDVEIVVQQEWMLDGRPLFATT